MNDLNYRLHAILEERPIPFDKYAEEIASACTAPKEKDLVEEINLKRLAEENSSRRGHIKIITYDDLLDQAKTVRYNLVKRPEVLKSKDSKSI